MALSHPPKSVTGAYRGPAETHAIYWEEAGSRHILQFDTEGRAHRNLVTVNDHEETNGRPRKFHVCHVTAFGIAA